MRLCRPLVLCLMLAACSVQPGADGGDAITTTSLDAPTEATGPVGTGREDMDTDVPLAAIAALPGPAALVTEPVPPVPDEPVAAAAAPEAAPVAAPEIAEPPSRAEAACTARGGVFAARLDGGAKSCVKRTGDSGKTCRRSSDCQGQCLARSGTCAPIDPLLGCNEILQNDGVRVTLCLD